MTEQNGRCDDCGRAGYELCYDRNDRLVCAICHHGGSKKEPPPVGVEPMGSTMVERVSSVLELTRVIRGVPL